MKTLVRIPASLAILAATALSASADAATESAALPAMAVKTADATAATDAGESAPPESRLLRSLSDPAAPLASQLPPEARAAEFRPGTAGSPANGVLLGCPRALLSALLAGAADTGEAVAALAIERETLALCRERQEVVNGIVALEVELGALLAEARSTAAGPVAEAVDPAFAETPIVKESAPVRVVSLPPVEDDAGEAPKEAEAPADPAPAYFWFSIIGTAGGLRAGVGDGDRVWFVREGDRLPGAVVIEEIRAQPPGVLAAGAGEASLPYRPRPAGATRPGDGP